MKNALIPYSDLNSFFFFCPVGFKFNDSYHDHDCSTMQDLHLLFDEQREEGGEQEPDETEG